MNSTPDRLPSRPLRNWFLAWHIHTGDSAEVIAQGFDLDEALVAQLLSGVAPLIIGTGEAWRICRSLRVAPEVFWPNLKSRGSWCSEPIDPVFSQMLVVLGGNLRHS